MKYFSTHWTPSPKLFYMWWPILGMSGVSPVPVFYPASRDVMSGTVQTQSLASESSLTEDVHRRHASETPHESRVVKSVVMQ